MLKRSSSALGQERDILKWVYSRYRPRTPFDPHYDENLSERIADELTFVFGGTVHHALLQRVTALIADRMWVPREANVGWDIVEERLKRLKAAQKRLRRNKGDAAIRHEAISAANELSRRLAELQERMGTTGHNGSPEKDADWQIIPQSVPRLKELAAEASDELQLSSVSTSRLLRIVANLRDEAVRNGRKSQRVSMATDAFAVSFGAKLGEKAANDAWHIFRLSLFLGVLLTWFVASTFSSLATDVGVGVRASLNTSASNHSVVHPESKRRRKVAAPRAFGVSGTPHRN